MSRTVTIDTNEFLFTDQNGRKSYVTNGQTFTITGEGAGSTLFKIAPAKEGISLEDGRKIRFDSKLSSLTVVEGGTAALNSGAIWIEEDNGYRCKWIVTSCTIDNVTTPTELTIVMNRSDNPRVTCTLTTLTVGA